MNPAYLSLLYSISDKPLEYWSKQVSRSGRIRKIFDLDLHENVIEIQDLEPFSAPNTSITCPREPFQLLHIELPVLVVVLKNLDVHFRLQLQVIDSKSCTHRFLFTNAESEKNTNPNRIVFSRVKLTLEPNWNKLEFNLSSLVKATLNRQYKASQRLEISANCRIRKIYFIDRHYDVDEVCSKLYDGFLDAYMLKWGITSVENATQTNGKRNKEKLNDSEKKGSKNSKQDCIPLGNDDLTTKLRRKANKVMENFFKKQSIKLSDIEEFKVSVKMKSYAIPKAPGIQGQPSLISTHVFDKPNVLRRFTDMNIPSKDNSLDSQSMASTKEDENLAVTLRSILQRKPKSAFYDARSFNDTSTTTEEAEKTEESNK